MHKRGRQDPSHEAMSNNVKTANHLQAERKEATNSLHEENLPRSNSKGEATAKPPRLAITQATSLQPTYVR